MPVRFCSAVGSGSTCKLQHKLKHFLAHEKLGRCTASLVSLQTQGVALPHQLAESTLEAAAASERKAKQEMCHLVLGAGKPGLDYGSMFAIACAKLRAASAWAQALAEISKTLSHVAC